MSQQLILFKQINVLYFFGMLDNQDIQVPQFITYYVDTVFLRSCAVKYIFRDINYYQVLLTLLFCIFAVVAEYYFIVIGLVNNKPLP
jgi:hypothetical protein